MVNLLNKVYFRARQTVNTIRNQRGAEAVEYIAVTAVIVALLTVIKTQMNTKASTIATSFVDKIEAWITSW